jgi:hypothetical protein
VLGRGRAQTLLALTLMVGWYSLSMDVRTEVAMSPESPRDRGERDGFFGGNNPPKGRDYYEYVDGQQAGQQQRKDFDQRNSEAIGKIADAIGGIFTDNNARPDAPPTAPATPAQMRRGGAGCVVGLVVYLVPLLFLLAEAGRNGSTMNNTPAMLMWVWAFAGLWVAVKLADAIGGK